MGVGRRGHLGDAGTRLLSAVRDHPGATICWVLVAARLGSWALDVLGAPLAELVRTVPDDAFYYLRISDNIAAGRGSTFDGIHPTNGFHPLWAVMLSVPAAVLDGAALLRVSLLLGGLLVMGGYLVLARVAATAVRLRPFGVAAGALVVTTPVAWERAVNGMESAVVVAAMAAVAVAASRWWDRPVVPRMAIVGLACGLLVTARLSHLATVLVVPVLLLWARRREGAVRSIPAQLVAWAGASFVLVAPYMAWSWLRLGTVLPSSSRMKAHWQEATTGALLGAEHLAAVSRSAAEELWRQVVAVVPFVDDAASWIRRALQVAALLLVSVGVASSLRHRPRTAIVIAPALAVALRYALEIATLPSQLNVWYAGPTFTLTALAVAFGVSMAQSHLQRATSTAPRSRVALMGVGLAGAIVLASAAGAHPSRQLSSAWGDATWAAARRLDHLPGDPVIGAFDAGQLGYLHPGVVNLDGLVREPAYVDRLLSEGTGPDVAVEQGIDVLVGRFTPDDPRVPPCAVELWRSATEVELGGSSEPVRLLTLDRC